MRISIILLVLLVSNVQSLAQIFDFGEELTVSSDSLDTKYEKPKMHKFDYGLYLGSSINASGFPFNSHYFEPIFEGGIILKQRVGDKHSFGLNTGVQSFQLQKEQYGVNYKSSIASPTFTQPNRIIIYHKY